VAVNRWLPPNSALNSGMSAAMSTSGWNKLLAIAALCSALFMGRGFLAAWLSYPETVEQLKSTESASRMRVDQLEQEHSKTQLEVIEMRHDNELREAERRHREEQQIAEAERARENAEREKELETAKRLLELERAKSAELERQRRAAEREREKREEQSWLDRLPQEYRVTVEGPLGERDRDYFRGRLADACGVPASSIVDVPRGFIIVSNRCEEWGIGKVVWQKAPARARPTPQE
jgi:hypothetical protein